MHDAHDFLKTLALVLCAAAVTTVLFQRLRQPVVLGYLLAGLVIGPYVPIPLEANSQVVQTLAELGVILLMFSLGIEFSLQKLMRVGATASFVAIVQCSVMIWLGYMVGQSLGWSRLASFYAGAMISISSTTIIVKAFEEQRVQGDFTQIVFGVLIVEDLVAILLITVLTALSSGEELGLAEVALTAGKLAMFLASLLVVGLLTVPRAMRAVVRLNRVETTTVASVGLAFGFALLAAAFGYSVALGAFLAGSLVAESGVEHKIGQLVQPVRDIFAAVFFVSVGMLIDPAQIAAHWPVVLLFLGVVVVGQICSVTFSAFFSGQSVQTSVKTGMSLAQIGEFSFIIAGVGVATGATDKLLYSIAVAVSGITTLLTPWFIRGASPTAAWVDRKLPHRLQTFVALYGAWLEQLGTAPLDDSTARLRRMVRWLGVDAVVVAANVIAASTQMDLLADRVEENLSISAAAATWVLVAGATLLSSPFWIGMIRVARFLGLELANRTFPRNQPGKVDLADAPRRLLVVTLQMAIVILVGFPLVAITQPFLPPLQGAAVLFLLLALLAVSLWNRATNFQGHTRAAAQAIAESLAQQTRDGRAQPGHNIEDLNPMLTGLEPPVPVELVPGSPAVGKSLAELRLRGLTGATVLAIRRGNEPVLVPSGDERLQVGDVLALAGPHDSIESATEILKGRND